MAQSFYEPERFSVHSAVVRWFRCFKHRPVASWTQLACDWVLLGTLATGFGLLVIAPLMEQLETDAEQTQNLGLFLTGYLGFAILFMVYIWVVDAAWNRLLTGRPMKRAIPYRIGADEWRSLVVYGVSSAIIMGVSMGIYMVLAIAMLVVMLAVNGVAALGATAGDPSSAQFWVVQLLPFVILLFMMLVTNYIGLRLNTGAPLAIKRQQLDVLGGWDATKPFAGRLLVAGAGIIILGYVLILAVQLGAVSAVMIVAPETSADTLPIADGLAMMGVIGFAMLAYYLMFQMVRGVVAEAAMVATAGDAASQTEATPPASPDAPAPTPQG
ncbi:hypothetical protein ACFELO_05140 [Oceanicaulis sp. LC35]|uniref:hypothetical protein n=1 Tax=Oceanicaulis sp. LC35 TaxID=3349635 RepID=UPI003F87042B